MHHGESISPTAASFSPNYTIEGLLGLGGTSAIFTAQQKNDYLKDGWKVVLKMVWDTGLARQEAENLKKLSTGKGIINLLDYFEVPAAKVEPVIDAFIRTQSESLANSLRQKALAQKVTGVLVLQFLAGQPLIKKTATWEPPHFHMSKWPIFRNGFYVKDVESGQWMKQELRWPLKPAEKARILFELAKILKSCHEKGVVHGDLKPQNILYHDKHQTVDLLDFGGAGTRGSPGWQAPEHLLEIGGKVTSKTDIFLFGLLLHRFFEQEPRAKAYFKLAKQCCVWVPEDRPNIDEVIEKLAAIREKKKRPLASFALALLLAAAIVLPLNWPFRSTWRPENLAIISYPGDDLHTLYLQEFLANGIQAMGISQVDQEALWKRIRKETKSGQAMTQEIQEKLLFQFGADSGLMGSLAKGEDGAFEWTGELVKRPGGPVQKIQARGKTLAEVGNQVLAMMQHRFGTGAGEIPGLGSPFSLANDLHMEGLYNLMFENYGKAMVYLEDAIRYDPSLWFAKLDLARSYFHGGEWAKCLTVIQELISGDTSNEIKFESYLLCSKIERAKGNVDASWELLQAAQSIQPREKGKIQKAFGGHFSFFKEKDKALENYRRAEAAFLEQNRVIELADTYIGMANLFDRIQPERYAYLEKAIEVSEKNQLHGVQALALAKLAFSRAFSGDDLTDPQTVAQFERALALLDEYDAIKNIQIQSLLAELYAKNGEINQAERILQAIYERAEQLGLKIDAANIANILIEVYMEKEALDMALELALTNLEFFRKTQWLSGLRQTLSYAYDIYGKLGDFPKAYAFLEEYRRLCDNPKAIGYYHNNLGEIKEREGLFDEAREQYLRSIRIKEELGDQYGLAWTLRNLTILAIKMGDLPAAEATFQPLMGSDKLDNLLIEARIHYEKHDFAKAFELMETARRIGQKKGNWKSENERAFQLYRASYQDNRWRKLPVQYGNYF